MLRHHGRVLLRASHLTGIFFVVVGRLHIDNLIIDDVALSLIDLKKHCFHLLSSVTVLKLHLDEAESATSLRLPVSHYDCIGHSAIRLEVIDQVRLYKD